jgi:dipeptidyl-peptidase 4
MKRTVLLITVVLGMTGPAQAQPLLTVAERSDYKATSKNSEVIEYCQELAKKSPLIRLAEIGATAEGRKLPLVILADPPVATPEEAVKSGKLVVFAMGNIHAGEVDGKEALLMLMRDLALAKDRPLLKDLVILCVPNFNADGGDKLSAKNRTKQNGPPEVGTRENAQKYDLNRDYIKLESPECRALVQFFNKWDPALIIDTHTTDGSYHNFLITYYGPRHPACDAHLVDFTRDSLLPDLGIRLKKHSGYLANFYGNFADNKRRWDTYPAQPRYGTQYVGLRHRIGILCESYIYAPYKDRVLASRDFVLSCFEYAAQNKDVVRKLLKDAEANSAKAKVALQHKQVPLGKEVTIVGIEGGKTAPPGTTKEFVVTYLGKCESTLEVTRPFAYVVPASFKKAIDTLELHGIILEQLKDNAEVPAEIYRVEKLTLEPPYQGHKAVKVDAKVRTEKRGLKAGDIVVRLDQPLGTLAAFLLEPQSEDGLCTWNFFDAGLKEGTDYPVVRLAAKVDLKIERLSGK